MKKKAPAAKIPVSDNKPKAAVPVVTPAPKEKPVTVKPVTPEVKNDAKVKAVPSHPVPAPKVNVPIPAAKNEPPVDITKATPRPLPVE
ncbi:MAG: hypothetical protein IPP46_04825 [Bacteroidetes bacterium]|nr:hypothetical protein [Bacteroidota bacterium]